MAPTGPNPTSSRKDKCTEVSLLGVEQDGAYTWREQRISSPLKLDLGFPYNLRYGDDTTLMAESKEELKRLFLKVKEESENAGLKHSKNKNHGIRSHYFMANRWGNNANGDTLSFLWAPKITADGD